MIQEEQKESEEKKGGEKLGDFLKWYFRIDFKDITNYIALVMAILLLWWGIKNIMSAMSLTP